jgi:hypothetical protein
MSLRAQRSNRQVDSCFRRACPMLDRENDRGRLADVGQPTPLQAVDGNIHSLLNNSRRVPNFEFIPPYGG